MKTTFAIALLPLLDLTSSTPINCAITDYNYKSCHRRLVEHLLLNGLKDAISPTKSITAPLPPPEWAHLFPNHHEEEEAATERNSPYIPSKKTPASITLALNQPLSTEYLLSLSESFKDTAQKVLGGGDAHNAQTNPAAAKPTSALPQLREDDMEGYWADEDRVDAEKAVEAAVSGKIKSANMLLPGNLYIETRNLSRGRDSMVVGIVLLFLLLVIAVEGAEKLGALKTHIMTLISSAKSSTSTSPSAGEIYLPTKESFAYNTNPETFPLSIQADNKLPTYEN